MGPDIDGLVVQEEDAAERASIAVGGLSVAGDEEGVVFAPVRKLVPRP